LIDKIKATQTQNGLGDLTRAKLESGAYGNPYGCRIKIGINLPIRPDLIGGKSWD
jgi:hypothetical protein